MKNKFIIITLIVLTTIIVTGCETSFSEKRQIVNNGIDYFIKKYNAKEKDIERLSNHVYGKEETCIGSCGDNYINIKYKNKKVKIEYNREEDSYTDNYQYDQIYKAFSNYLNKKFDYVSEIKIDSLDTDVSNTPNKYNGDIENYIKKLKKRKYSEDEIGNVYTYVKIKIRVADENEAREANQKYSNEIMKELDDLEVNYWITILTNSGVSESKTFYSYAVDSYFHLNDYVDNKTTHYKR